MRSGHRGAGERRPADHLQLDRHGIEKLRSGGPYLSRGLASALGLFRGQLGTGRPAEEGALLEPCIPCGDGPPPAKLRFTASSGGKVMRCRVI